MDASGMSIIALAALAFVALVIIGVTVALVAFLMTRRANTSSTGELAHLRAENARLREENERLRMGRGGNDATATDIKV